MPASSKNYGSWLTIGALVALDFAVPLFADTPSTYCSLIVRVTDPKGLPLVTTVTVVDQESRRTMRKSGNDGVVEFCGLGIKPVAVTVASGACDEVTVRNVMLHWGTTRALPMTYAACWLEEEPPPGDNACEILFRFYDIRGNPLQGVSLATEHGLLEHTSDGFGRLRSGVGIAKVFEGSASAPGFQPKRVSVPCSKADRLIELD